MYEKPMPCSLVELGSADRETGQSTGGPDSQSVATLGEPYTPRTGRAETRRQDRGARRV